MSASTKPTSRRKAGARRRRRTPLGRMRPASSFLPAFTATTSAQRDGGPQDSALYQCGCGCHFHAAVSTSVGCPACGGTQAW